MILKPESLYNSQIPQFQNTCRSLHDSYNVKMYEIFVVKLSWGLETKNDINKQRNVLSSELSVPTFR